MEALTKDDILVLIHVQAKARKPTDRLKEMPDKTIRESLQRLMERGYVMEEKGEYHLTYDGEQFMEKQDMVVGDRYDEYFKAHAS